MGDARDGPASGAAVDPAAATRCLPVRWQWSAFDSLLPRELHAALRLRAAVFVVEQQCVFLDPDAHDADAWHLLGWCSHAASASELAAYVRLLPPGKYREPSIGRVVTAAAHRGRGLARGAMVEAMHRARELFPRSAVRIGAQRYLQQFYASLGFVQASAPYHEDGIEHIEMLWDGQATLP